MLETGTDSRLQPAPLPNKKVPFTSHFMNSIVRSAAGNRFYGVTSEIMKTIIARDITGLRG
jgi:hypothetical protein